MKDTTATVKSATRTVVKYLATYGEPEARLITSANPPWPQASRFQDVLVIPAYRESPDFFYRLADSLMRYHSLLLIVVVNQPDTVASTVPENAHLWATIATRTSSIWRNEHLHLLNLEGTLSAVLLVDRFSHLAIPGKQGVGLARKIGADLALTLMNLGYISQPWIYSSDADAHLPIDYFSALPASAQQQYAAAVYPFLHLCNDDDIGRATRLYEQRMHHYVNGLRAAGSPYAYHTLGSALAIRDTSYAQVRGFPKRSGAEDFYLLNKAAKVGPILSLTTSPIQIEARPSDRVPFGTGPAINRLLTDKDADNAAIFYHPDVFAHLHQWLILMPDTRVYPIADLSLPEITKRALAELGIEQASRAARKTSNTQDNYNKHMHTWFDGFKTLRFIHLLRDHGLQNVRSGQVTSLY